MLEEVRVVHVSVWPKGNFSDGDSARFEAASHLVRVGVVDELTLVVIQVERKGLDSIVGTCKLLAVDRVVGAASAKLSYGGFDVVPGNPRLELWNEVHCSIIGDDDQ